jgi:hypothetical protein
MIDDDFESILLREQNNPTAAILQFFLSKYNGEEIIVFVEGQDDAPFYYDFISSYFPTDTVFFFVCGGKRSLIVMKDFFEGYPLSPMPKKMLYLADRDFDDYLKVVDEGIFKTDQYSIESYFFDRAYFEHVLRKHCATQLSNKSMDGLISGFDQNLQNAVQHLKAPMALICALRAKGSDIDLDSISVADFVQLTQAGQIERRRNRKAAFQTLLKDDPSMPHCALILRFAREFSPDRFQSWIRGKYGLQLMRLMVRALGMKDTRSAPHLHKIATAFGSDALKHAKVFLTDIPALNAYCCQPSDSRYSAKPLIPPVEAPRLRAESQGAESEM